MGSGSLKRGSSLDEDLAKIGLTLEEARKLQKKLASQVIEVDCFDKIENICGLDVSYYKNTAIACGVVLDRRNLQVLEEKVIYEEVSFPYIPTLLSFRETPPMLRVAKSLESSVDLFMVDSNGRLHPYLLGAASHFGILIDAPTIGVAKTLLCGRVSQKRGEEKYSLITLEGRVVGAAVTTGTEKKPVYVSVGHKISLETAINIVLETSKLRLPEPIRQAHKLSKSIKRELKDRNQFQKIV